MIVLSMLLYGDSDIGKTMIVDKFVRDHPNICNQFGEVEARKVLRLQMPSKPNDGRLYAQIIDGLGHNAPYTRRGTDLEILVRISANVTDDFGNVTGLSGRC